MTDSPKTADDLDNKRKVWLREAPRDAVFSECTLPDFPLPHVTLPRETVIEFRNFHTMLIETMSAVYGVDPNKLCVADILFRKLPTAEALTQARREGRRLGLEEAADIPLRLTMGREDDSWRDLSDFASDVEFEIRALIDSGDT